MRCGKQMRSGSGWAGRQELFTAQVTSPKECTGRLLSGSNGTMMSCPTSTFKSLHASLAFYIAFSTKYLFRKTACTDDLALRRSASTSLVFPQMYKSFSSAFQFLWDEQRSAIERRIDGRRKAGNTSVMKISKSDQNQRPTSGCLEVLLPPTLEFPEGSSARFILMTPESYLETLNSGSLLDPSAHEPKDSSFPPGF